MKIEKRQSEDGMVIYVNWEDKRIITKGIEKGTYYYTSYGSGSFAGWRTRKEIKKQYPFIY
jgi:hypothetical protein